MTERKAVVAGGGIGGLATAAALHRRGWDVQVLERADFTEVGAGLSLWPNALRALDAIGVGDQVRAAGAVEMTAGLRRPSGRWLTRSDTAQLTRRYGAVIMLHRADLLGALLKAVPPRSLVAGTEVRAVQQTGDRVTVRHTGGTIDADLVVGADGLRSAVRASLWPQAPSPRYAGYTAWRMVTPPLTPRLTEGGETWGAGHRFGYASLPDGRVYCYATANLPEGTALPRGDRVELADRFGAWHDPIPRLLAAAADVPVLRHDLYELPALSSYAKGRVALLGDAAHAMTPNLGQGACQALEDAATLAAMLDRAPTVAAALARYDALRRPRAQSIVDLSRRTGRAGQWSWRPAVAARDAVMTLVPPAVTIRSLGRVVDWTAP